METANMILQQLGGNRFLAMTGAKNLIGGERMLQFDMPSRLTRDKSNKMRITLSDLDLYTVETYSVRGMKCNAKSSVDGVYAEQLASVFTSITGLDTHL